MPAITISDQGIPFRDAETPHRRVRQQPHGDDVAREPETAVGIVTSDQLSASLQALEIAMNTNIQFGFSRAIGEACNSMVHASLLLKAAVLSNPTLTLRAMLKHQYIYGRAGGELAETWPCQPVTNFSLLPMGETCSAEVPIQFYIGNRMLKGFRNCDKYNHT